MLASLMSWRWKKLFKVWCAYQSVIHMPKTYHLWAGVLSMNSYNVLEQKTLRVKNSGFGNKRIIWFRPRGDTIWNSPTRHFSWCFESRNNQKLLQVWLFSPCSLRDFSRACFFSPVKPRTLRAMVARELARAGKFSTWLLAIFLRFSYEAQSWVKSHSLRRLVRFPSIVFKIAGLLLSSFWHL